MHAKQDIVIAYQFKASEFQSALNPFGEIGQKVALHARKFEGECRRAQRSVVQPKTYMNS
jgi:hypothetical protein